MRSRVAFVPAAFCLRDSTRPMISTMAQEWERNRAPLVPRWSSPEAILRPSGCRWVANRLAYRAVGREDNSAVREAKGGLGGRRTWRRITPRFSGPKLALLASAADRDVGLIRSSAIQ